MVTQTRTDTPFPDLTEPAPSPTIMIRDVLCAVTLAALLVIAGSAFTRIYSGSLILALLTGAAVCSVAISVIFRAVHSSLAASIAVSLVAMIGYVFFSITRTIQPGTGSVVSLFTESIRNSGAQILTSTIPILPTPQTVVLPLVVIWIAGAIGTELTLRTRTVLAGFAAPTIVYVVALVLVGPNAKPSLPLAGAFAGVAALGLALSGDSTISQVLRQLGVQSQKAFRVRRTAIGGVGLVALVVATMVIGPSMVNLSNVTPPDPRTRIPLPQQQLPESNPLGRLSGWARDPGQQLFTVKTDEPSRIRWATLTEYDGLTWLPGSNYRSAGSVLPDEQRAPKSTEVRQEVTMLGLDGLWLPAVEQPHQVDNVRISYDPTTGSLITAKGLRPGLRYDVVSERSDFDVSKLTNAPLSNLASIRHYTSVPSNLPDEIVNFATSIVAPAVTPYNRALLIEQYLLHNFTFSPDAASGHGLANLNFFLRTAPELGGRRGTSEQFAAAFALMARVTGLPTRISVGFHAGTPQGDGRYMVRSGDAFAWPEVYFAGFGWVPFDPSPRQDNSSPIPPDQATPQAQQQNRAKQNQLEELENPEPKPSPGNHPAKGTAEPTGKRVAHVGVFVLIAIVALLLIAMVGVIVGRLLLRRRRFGGPLPSDRVSGAWAELIDALRLVRQGPSPDMTAHQVALLAANVTPRRPDPLPPVTVVADVANAVSFAPQLISPAHADEAVKQTQAYVRQLRRRQKWIRRLLWWVRPGPLLWARSRKRAGSRADKPATDGGMGSTATVTQPSTAHLVWAPPRSVHIGSDGANS